ncbi:hypothetical protein KEJ18_05710 [Candidatus Bathyarchaeota archaeon]|nr:hypothetical protein [Candidatus Bathyarchaeota archaeon]
MKHPVTLTLDSPLTMRMLAYASQLMKSLGLNHDVNSDPILANEVGRLVRLTSAFLQIIKVDIKPHLVVRACVYHCLLHYMPSKTREFLGKYRFDRRTTLFLSKVLELRIIANGET